MRPSTSAADRVLDNPEATVLDLLDRLLRQGVMVTGDVTIGLAGVDLVYIRLSALLCAADRVLPPVRSARSRRRSSRTAAKGRLRARS